MLRFFLLPKNRTELSSHSGYKQINIRKGVLIMLTPRGALFRRNSSKVSAKILLWSESKHTAKDNCKSATHIHRSEDEEANRKPEREVRHADRLPATQTRR